MFQNDIPKYEFFGNILLFAKFWCAHFVDILSIVSVSPEVSTFIEFH